MDTSTRRGATSAGKTSSIFGSRVFFGLFSSIIIPFSCPHSAADFLVSRHRSRVTSLAFLFFARQPDGCVFLYEEHPAIHSNMQAGNLWRKLPLFFQQRLERCHALGRLAAEPRQPPQIATEEPQIAIYRLAAPLQAAPAGRCQPIIAWLPGKNGTSLAFSCWLFPFLYCCCIQPMGD